MKKHRIKTGKIMKSAYLALVALLIIFFNACKSNPVVQGQASILEITEGPAEGDTVRTDDVRFGWIGRGAADFTYSYKLDFYPDGETPKPLYEYTEATTQISRTFNNLDDGKYKFYVKAFLKELNPSPETRTFYVLAVQGPTVILYRNRTEIALGETKTVSLKMVDISSLKALEGYIQFDKDAVEFVSIEPGDLVEQTNGQLLIVPDFSNQSTIDQDNQSGVIEFALIFLKDPGSLSNGYLSGTGEIINISFSPKTTGSSELLLEIGKALDQYGSPLELIDPKPGSIVGTSGN